MSTDRNCQCTRCKNKHLESERKSVQDKKFSFASDLVCPRCGCKNFYDITPAKAWCRMSGVIGMGTADEQLDPYAGKPILFATGPHCDLTTRLNREAERAMFGWVVPGMPKAKDEKDAMVILRLWVNRCSYANGSRLARGVVFDLEVEA